MCCKLHIVPGLKDCANGMAVVASLLAREHATARVVDLNYGLDVLNTCNADEVWVHGMWLPQEWAVCRKVLCLGKRLVRMTHGSLSPVCLNNQSKWKKRLVSPVEKWILRRSNNIVATCEAEVGWIKEYLGDRYPRIEVMDMRRFFNLPKTESEPLPKDRPLHLLYLGREHPLKGIEYLKSALANLPNVELQVVSNAVGVEKDDAWHWCDCLVLPTLSENFGLVIAEALEHGKRVITTDGAPAWGDGNDYGGRLFYLKGYRDGTNETRVSLLRDAIEQLL